MDAVAGSPRRARRVAAHRRKLSGWKRFTYKENSRGTFACSGDGRIVPKLPNICRTSTAAYRVSLLGFLSPRRFIANERIVRFGKSGARPMAKDPTILEWSKDHPGCPTCGGREVEVHGIDAAGTVRGHCPKCGKETDAKQIWEHSQSQDAAE